MRPSPFSIIWVIGLFVASTIRTFFGMKYRQDSQQRESYQQESFGVKFFMGMWGVAQMLPFVWFFTNKLDFANYKLSRRSKTVMGVVGTAVFACAQWLMYRSHSDLDRNWSPTLEIGEEHTLVTDGVYRDIRHPMYAAHILHAIGQLFLLPNWIAGWSALFAILPLYWLRKPHEEAMMVETFGQEYETYRQQTGGVIPKKFN